jgi:hypothetical protein
VAAATTAAEAEAADVASPVGNPMKAWTKGDRVVQPTYGPGTLVEVNEHHTVIDFDEHGRRVFATRLVTLQATNEPAPAKAARKRAVRAKTKEAKDGANEVKDGAKEGSKPSRSRAKEAKEAKEAKA